MVEPLLFGHDRSERKGRCSHIHSQSPHQHEATSSNKNHSEMEHTTQCYLPGRLLSPARLADEIFMQCVSSGRRPSDNGLEPRRPSAPSGSGLAEAVAPNSHGILLRVIYEVAQRPDDARAGVRAVRWSLMVNNQRGLELIYFPTSTERTVAERRPGSICRGCVRRRAPGPCERARSSTCCAGGFERSEERFTTPV